MTTDERVVAKQEIQEVESAKRAGVPYAHRRYQAIAGLFTKANPGYKSGLCLALIGALDLLSAADWNILISLRDLGLGDSRVSTRSTCTVHFCKTKDWCLGTI